ncbi:hypothetical protein [Novosphingobium sp. AP12]|uniref:hypothetical protein n=1 Tax=Novosphingobium sp. AP12 TaxID=1144305 RepID=UPI0002721F7F|nr:hypothetical protein [Novosphingobium sp. AP12]EJL22228.1 hypothetical protein PMI02_04778 [Novosphingobium sp. AP12]
MSETQQILAANMPNPNPWLTQSVYPTSHFNPGATDSVTVAGPVQGKTLVEGEDAKFVRNFMVSNPTLKKIGTDTVAFASGMFGLRKLLLTGKALESISYMAYPGFEAIFEGADEATVEALLAKWDVARREGDDAKLIEAIRGISDLGFTHALGINGVYNLFDRDGFHYCVFGGTRVLKCTDDNEVRAPARVVKLADVATAVPAEVAQSVSRIIALSMTYDGFLVAAAPGAVIILDRDLNVKSYVAFSGEAVDNAVPVDEDGGIYVVTSRRMLKVVWNGETLSSDEKDGAWESGYEWMPDEKAFALGSISRGSGTTPTLMGFGDDPDKLVVIADGAEGGTNLVAFWRDDIPEDFEQKPGTKSRRIADQARIEISKATIEPSPNVLGYGVAIVNSTYPEPFPEPGFHNGFMAGVTRPAPKGIQKFNWNPATRRFEQDWLNAEIDNSDIMVPVVSAATGLLYAANKRGLTYEYAGLDWTTGEIRARWVFPDDSAMWNAFGGITTILEDGDLLIGGAFAIKRVVG